MPANNFEVSTLKPAPKYSAKWCLGLFVASIFSLSYFFAPGYMLAALLMLLFRYPSLQFAWIFSAPIFISALLPPITGPWAWKMIRPILDYFEYEEIRENKPIDVKNEILKGKSYLCIFQPHGVISFGGICSAANAPPGFVGGHMPTAVADALLATPILKHIMGIFGLISASKKSLQRQLKKSGPEGTVVLYVGGMAEMFLSSEKIDRLYLMKRKGFIKLALQEGVDVVPIYLFGNTNVLSLLKNKFLATVSRKLQVSLTYVWGRWLLPIPRDCKLLYVSGQPIGLPKIENPTQADIDKYHAKYVSEVKRIFETYKDRVPEYKNKQLEIL